MDAWCIQLNRVALAVFLRLFPWHRKIPKKQRKIKSILTFSQRTKSIKVGVGNTLLALNGNLWRTFIPLNCCMGSTLWKAEFFYIANFGYCKLFSSLQAMRTSCLQSLKTLWQLFAAQVFFWLRQNNFTRNLYTQVVSERQYKKTILSLKSLLHHCNKFKYEATLLSEVSCTSVIQCSCLTLLSLNCVYSFWLAVLRLGCD